MGLGNGNPKSGNKGSNFSFEHRQLILLGETLQSLGLLATEATLLSVLNAIVAHQDMEILLVRDKGAADLVVQQIREYDETTQTWTTSYQDVSGNPYVPVGPLEYLDPSAVLNLILTELLDQGITLDNILISIDDILDTIHLEVDDDAIAVEQELPTNINLLYGAFEGEGTEWERIQTDGDGRLKGIYDLLIELTAINNNTDNVEALLTAIDTVLDNSLIQLQAINVNTDQLEALSTDIKNLLTTIDADTSNLDTPLSTLATQATLELCRLLLVDLKANTTNLATQTTLAAVLAELQGVLDVTFTNSSIEVTQGLHDNLNANANLQVENVDVSGTNPVPVSLPSGVAQGMYRLRLSGITTHIITAGATSMSFINVSDVAATFTDSTSTVSSIEPGEEFSFEASGNNTLGSVQVDTPVGSEVVWVGVY